MMGEQRTINALQEPILEDRHHECLYKLDVAAESWQEFGSPCECGTRCQVSDALLVVYRLEGLTQVAGLRRHQLSPSNPRRA